MLVRAQITPTDAVGHLYHFCSILTKDPFVDPSPTFIFEEHSLNPKKRSISARVLLPTSVDLSVREASSQSRWRSEKSARREAAFRAYLALYQAGLVNDNLLPVRAVDAEVEAALSKVELRPNIVEVAGQIDLWPSIASAWKACDSIHAAKVSVSNSQTDDTELYLLFPLPVSKVETFTIYWDIKTRFTVEISPCPRTFPSSIISLAKTTTVSIFQLFRIHLVEKIDVCFGSMECGSVAISLLSILRHNTQYACQWTQN